jgi:uncharacterized protein
MGNPFVHVELMSSDVGKAKAFHGKLFDWKLEDMDMGDMTCTDQVEVKGGGSFRIITDPTRAMLGLWQPKKG